MTALRRQLAELRLWAWSYMHVHHGDLRLVGRPGDRHWRCSGCGSTCARPAGPA